jgi:hypothetical protein
MQVVLATCHVLLPTTHRLAAVSSRSIASDAYVAMPAAAVLVHCGAGVSRSATIAMAYLMRAQRASAAKARQQVSALRSVVCINDGFWRTLCALEAPLDLAERCGARCLPLRS